MPQFYYVIETEDATQKLSSAHDAAVAMNQIVGQNLFTRYMVQEYCVRKPRSGMINKFKDQFTLSRVPRLTTTYNQPDQPTKEHETEKLNEKAETLDTPMGANPGDDGNHPSDTLLNSVMAELRTNKSHLPNVYKYFLGEDVDSEEEQDNETKSESLPPERLQGIRPPRSTTPPPSVPPPPQVLEEEDMYEEPAVQRRPPGLISEEALERMKKRNRPVERRPARPRRESRFRNRTIHKCSSSNPTMSRLERMKLRWGHLEDPVSD